MSLVRYLVLICLRFNIQVGAEHVPGSKNRIIVFSGRGFETFRLGKRPLSLSSSYKYLPISVHHVENLAKSSLSTNSRNSYDNKKYSIYWYVKSLSCVGHNLAGSILGHLQLICLSVFWFTFLQKKLFNSLS